MEEETEDIAELWEGLIADIEDVYEQEVEYEASRKDSLPNGEEKGVGSKGKALTGKGLTSGGSSIRDLIANGDYMGENLKVENVQPCTRLDVVVSWKQLVEEMHKSNAFLEYVILVENSFLALASIESYYYQMQKNIIDMIKHTVENRDEDPSTECRFVTLLEIAGSYGTEWEPSEELVQCWESIMQKVPLDILPVDFRRGAYGVLVSLPWVPPSSGLLEACSISDSRPLQSLLISNSPEPAQAALSKIHNSPCHRDHNVYQILDRFKDETHVCIAISSSSHGESGDGKTTLAAIVASHPLINKMFTVVWLSMRNINQNKATTYAKTPQIKRIKDKLNIYRYIELLENICQQLSIQPKWPDSSSMFRLEEPALREKREGDEMIRVKTAMASYLQETGRKYLLVLDDVHDNVQLDLFRFIDKQSLLVTTQSRHLDVDWSFDLQPWDEKAAIELFLLEADFPKSHVMASADEVKGIVKKCSYHPLTVRTVARWFKLKHVTAGPVDGLIESNGELSSSQVLDNVLNQALSPAMKSGKSSILFKLCLLSMAIVFSDFGPVPLDAVLFLWQHLIKTDAAARDEIGENLTPTELQRRVWIFLEGLVHLGLILITEKNGNPCVEIYHHMYVDFSLANILELGPHISSVEDAQVTWHKAFVTCYLAKKAESNVDNCREYAMEKLVTHMIRAKLFQKAEALLGDGRLYQARLMALGWKRGTELHVQDCMVLQHEMKRNDEDPEDVLSALCNIMNNMAKFLSSEANKGDIEEDGIVEISKALHFIGFSLAENCLYAEAIASFKDAQKLLPKSHPFNITILYGVSSVYLAANEYEKALKKLSAGVKSLNSAEKKDILYPGVVRLQGEALIAYCNYREGSNHFSFIAKQLEKDTFDCRIDYGILLYQKGRLHYVMGENEQAIDTLMECISWKLKIGETSRNLSEAYSTLGDVYMQTTQVSEAKKYYENAISILQDLTIKFEQEKVDSCERLPADTEMQLLTGKVRYLRTDCPVDLTNFENARNQILQAPILLMDKSAYDLRCMAQAYEASDDIDTAMSLMESALELLADRHDSLEKAACLLEMGTYLSEQQLRLDALACFENALEIQILKLGECEQVLETLNLIGNVHATNGSHEEALRIYGKVLELTDKLCGNDNEKVASALFAIGEAQEGLGQNGKAETAYKECLEVIKRDRRDDHPDVAKTLQRLGTVASAQGSLDNAYFYYTEALQIRQANFGSHHAALGETLHGLGVLARMRGEYESAREFLADALSIWKDYNCDLETGQSLLEIGHIHRLLGNLEHAMGCYMECLDMVENSDGGYEHLLGSVYLAMGNTNFSLGKDAEALRCCERAYVVRMKLYGENHIKTANVCRSLGIMKFVSNNDGAVRRLHDFVKVMDKHDTRGNKEYVIAMLMLGDIHKAGGCRKLAKQAWKVANDVCSKHPDIRKMYPQIVNMLDKRIQEVRKPKSHGRKNIFSRLQELGRLGEEEISRGDVVHNPKEISILRQIVLLDD